MTVLILKGGHTLHVIHLYCTYFIQGVGNLIFILKLIMLLPLIVHPPLKDEGCFLEHASLQVSFIVIPIFFMSNTNMTPIEKLVQSLSYVDLSRC